MEENKEEKTISAEYKRDTEKIVERLREGPSTPEELISIIGHKFLSKALGKLKSFGFEFRFKVAERHGKYELITMTKEGVIPPRGRAGAKPGKKSTPARYEAYKAKVEANKKQEETFDEEETLNSLGFALDKNVDDVYHMIDPEFDSTTPLDIINSFRGRGS